MTKKTWLAAAAALLGGTAAALAQPVPATPAPPSVPAETLPPTPPSPPAPPTTVETTITAEIPAEAPKKGDKPAVSAVYDGGIKFSTADDAFELKLVFRNQVRFEANRSLDSESDTRHNQFNDHFYIARSRFQAEGHLLKHDGRFRVELGLGDSGSFSYVRDAFVEKSLAPQVWLRAGQWKRPFNRMELVSDFASAFNERAIENDLAGGGRDLGVAIHNDYEKSPAGLEWVVGMFNGFSGGADRPGYPGSCTDENTSTACANFRPSTFPNDFGPTLVARAAFNSPNVKGYSESDLDGGPLRYSVGAGYKVDLGNFAKQDQASWSDNLKHGFEIDGIIKVNGVSVHAGAVLMKLETADADVGVLLQPGFMVVPKTIELAARFAYTTEHAKDRNQIEARAAFNYFFKGQAWKLATDGGFVEYTGDGAKGDKPDLQFRAMLQLQL